MAEPITAENIWVGRIEDREGGLADKLEIISGAGVELEFMIARRDQAEPGSGIVFLAPCRGADVTDVAERAGLSEWTSGYSLRIEVPDRAQLGARITRAVAEAGVSMRGVSAAQLGGRAVFHLAFDNAADADRARTAIGRVIDA